MHTVRNRAENTLEHLGMGWRSLRRRRADEPEAVNEPEDEYEDDDSSAAPLFFWGVLTALLLWWLYLRPATTERRLLAQQPRPQPQPEPRPEPRPASPSAITAQAAETGEDDLTMIYGIGPARAARLQEAGISTFEALAVADAEQLRDILSGVGVGVGNSEVSSWPEQASLAAKGDWEGLQAYHERLRAGRE